MTVAWLQNLTADDVSVAGGKGASLGELARNDLPVPQGFVVTADTYRTFIEETGLAEPMFAAVDVDTDDPKAVEDASETVRSRIEGTEIPDRIRAEILDAYDELGTDVPVAVRSSATAEDLPDASFAGQQETFLNVTRDDLLASVRDCWASLFTKRAIYYRQEQGFDHDAVDIAVVVQRMVDAEKSGVLFTSHPSTGAPRSIVEAAWGLGEAVVSGAVTPDNYVVDRKLGEVVETSVETKTVQHVRDPESGETVERPVPEERRDERVLTDEEIERLVSLGERVETHYGTPQDVEWAIVGDDLSLLQSRPITTIDAGAADGQSTAEASGAEAADGGATAASPEADDSLVRGIGAVPGVAAGRVRLVRKLDQLDKVEGGDVIVTEMTTPDMVPAMERATGIVTDEGGMTSHAAIISRELGVPAVVGARDATSVLEDGRYVRLDGSTGRVTATDPSDADDSTSTADASERTGDSTAAAAADGEHADATARQAQPAKPMTGTRVKVNVNIPEAAERAAATGADGVGLLRLEHAILSTGETPEHFIRERGADAYVRHLADSVRTVADEFYPRPVRVRTLDAPTDEFRQLDGGEDEPVEHNPMLGYRGIRRSLDTPDLFGHELRAFRRLYEMGYDNVELMFPLVNDPADVLEARDRLSEAGIDPENRTWGVMVETPAAALTIDGICETGVEFVSFGTNDLTQYTLAVDRNNERVADRYDELHPAVLSLVEDAITTCRANDVATSICGVAASDPGMIRHLVEAGITSISVHVDAVDDAHREVKRVEQRCILEAIRD